MKKRVFLVLGILILVIGTILTVQILNYYDPVNREARWKKYYIKHVNEDLGISVSVSDIQFGPFFDAIQDWDERVVLFIADDAETVEKTLEEAGWSHEPMPYYLSEGMIENKTYDIQMRRETGLPHEPRSFFASERMLDDEITYDLQLRSLMEQNDYWWFYRDDYYAAHGEKISIGKHPSVHFTYAIYFPELNTMYYRECCT